MLTVAKINSLKPSTKNYKITDGDGLRLHIKTNQHAGGYAIDDDTCGYEYNDGGRYTKDKEALTFCSAKTSIYTTFVK